MKVKKVISVLLLAFVLFSIAYLIKGEVMNKKEEKMQKEEIREEVDTVNEKETETNKEKVPEIPNVNVAKNETKTQNSAPKKEEKKKKVLAYYFHGTYRCPTCLTIERYSKEAIEQYFAKEIQNGILEFSSINAEEPENRHFIQDYQLYTKSLIISLKEDNKEIKWKNLTEVWSYIHSKENFYQYVKNEVEKFLEEAR
ncbi:MAG: nitrophenyl compound nitroreductase subunit ArsF family protein [candidate division WOR-3 bacterium]